MSKPGHEEQVREALRSVLKLKVLERSIAHLAEVEREYGKKMRTSNDMDAEARQMIGELEDLRNEIESVKSSREGTASELDACKGQLAEVNEQLRSLEGLRDVLAREMQIDTLLETKEDRCIELIEGLGENLGRAGPAVANRALSIAQQILDEKRTRGEIPSNIRRQLVDDLLRDGTCICARPLDADSRKALVKRRDEALPGQLEDVVLTSAGHIASLVSRNDLVPSTIAERLREYQASRSAMDELQREKEALRQRLGEDLRGRASADVSGKVQGLEETRQGLERKSNDLSFSLGRTDAELQRMESEEQQKRDQLQRMKTQDQAAAREKRRYELASLARAAAESLLQRFYEDMRTRIEAATDDIFKSLIWKDRAFEQVRILDDSRLDVIDRFGTSALRGLSAGERQVLSLSFIVAMSRVTGEEAPLVIDTPFGRISETPLHNIAGALPGISGQLILLVIDRELDESARKSMADRIGREYFLRYDDSTGATAIEEVT